MGKAKTPERRTLYTVGHAKRALDELIAVLDSVHVARVVDIRAFPRSRTNPQFNTDALPAALAQHGIGYSHLAALGGRRRKSHVDPSTNSGWQVQAFHNYADYAATAEFRAGLAELLALAAHETCAIMCAEAVWWRCHRRIVTDHVLAHGVPVVHLLSATRRDAATLTEFASPGKNREVTYPAPRERPG